MNRRTFIKNAGLSAAALGLAGCGLAGSNADKAKLTILHTNDVHSRIDPFPAGHKFEGLGGFARRAAIIDNIRSAEKNVLLLDSGDIFQGTPYFNFFKGKLEIDLMNKMRYDATTLGNHEFDNGLDALAQRISQAEFPFVNANYTFNHNGLKSMVKPHVIKEIENFKIGIYGLGVKLKGLVDPKLCEGTEYTDALATAINIEQELKHQHGCDFIICLSHLGFENENQVDDIGLAKSTAFTNLILGGHTHTLLEKPQEIKNSNDHIILINQMGYGGTRLGRIDIVLNHKAWKYGSQALVVK